jgi:hypothetical protein
VRGDPGEARPLTVTQRINSCPELQCHGKHTYLTKAAAKAAARHAERFYGRMQAYRCPHCDRFHIGHPRRAA